MTHLFRITHHASRITHHVHAHLRGPHEASAEAHPLVLRRPLRGEIVAVMMPKKDGEYHVREFGRLPVLLNGRIQPFDSVARNSLLQIRSTGDVPLEEVPSWKFWHHPKKLKSTEWLLEVMTRPEVADTRPIFLIHHAELLGELKLQDKGVEKSGLRYYTFNELKPLARRDQRAGPQGRRGQVRGPDHVPEAGRQAGQRPLPLPAAQGHPPARRRGRLRAGTRRLPEEPRPRPGRRAGQRERQALRQGSPPPDRRAAAGVPVNGPVRLPAHRAAADSGRGARPLANYGRQPARIRPRRPSSIPP